VLLDANAVNILNAMKQLEAIRASDDTGNTYELKLADAAYKHGGVPYPDGTFDFISMIGDSDGLMATGKLLAVLKEAFSNGRCASSVKSLPESLISPAVSSISYVTPPRIGAHVSAPK